MKNIIFVLCLFVLQTVHGNDTFGFEVEHTGDFDTNRFVFLSDKVDQEDTGNNEMRSKVFRNRDNAQNSANLLVDTLGSQRKSFHLHRRILKDGSAKTQKNAGGLASRTSDIVFLWRLENMPVLASTSWSQRRLDPSNVAVTKGSVRLQDFGNEWDFEVRGVDRSPDYSFEISDQFANGLKNKDHLEVFQNVQKGLFLRTEHLKDAIERTARQKGLRLTPASFQALSKLESKIKYTAMMPLFHYEEDPTLTMNERLRVVDASLDFFDNVLEAVRNPRSDEEVLKSVQNSLKTWAKSSGLRQALTRTVEEAANPPTMRDLFMVPFKQRAKRASEIFLAHRIQRAETSGDERIASEASAVRNGRGISKWLENKISAELEKEEPKEDMLLRLRTEKGPIWERLIGEMFEHPSDTAKEVAARILYSRSPLEVPIDVLHEAIKNTSDPEAREHMTGILTRIVQQNVPYQQALKPLLKSKELSKVAKKQILAKIEEDCPAVFARLN